MFREAASKFPLLTERARSLADFRSLGAAIRRAILPNGEVSDDASSELRRIRGGLAHARETIQSTLERILKSRGAPQGEDYVTRRNDRFVIPIRASERRSVQGVVHVDATDPDRLRRASGCSFEQSPGAALQIRKRWRKSHASSKKA